MEIKEGTIVVQRHELEDVRARRIINGTAERALRELGIVVGMEDERSVVDIAIQHDVIRIDERPSMPLQASATTPRRIRRMPGHSSFA